MTSTTKFEDPRVKFGLDDHEAAVPKGKKRDTLIKIGKNTLALAGIMGASVGSIVFASKFTAHEDGKSDAPAVVHMSNPDQVIQERLALGMPNPELPVPVKSPTESQQP